MAAFMSGDSVQAPLSQCLARHSGYARWCYSIGVTAVSDASNLSSVTEKGTQS